MLKEGTKAPEFTLKNQFGEDISLSHFMGKKVVLYFYPRDNTPGCTKQACAFSAAKQEFEKRNTVVIGVSKDSTSSHKRFDEKHALGFTLLANPELDVLEKYDVWKEKKLYGKVSMGVVRSTYLIDENGVIVKALEKVKPDLNAQQMLDIIDGEK